MKQHLGKIIFLIFCTINLFASSANIKVSAPAIYEGDSVTFTLSATGKDVKFPNITEVEGYPIMGTSSGTSTSIINGNYTQTISKSYTFTPKKDITIPSFKIEVDGDELSTEAKKISVIKPQASKQGDPFMVELKVDKTNLKVGESTTLKVIFKQRLDAKANKLNLNEPKIENFWIKKVNKPKQYSEGEYMVTEYSYLIFAQKAGEFKVEPLEADIGRLSRRSNSFGGFFDDPFFSQMTNQLDWQKIYSNGLNLTVDKLPDGIELYGDFNIDATADKTTVYANKPINLTINIKGSGNIDDIQKFDINLPDAIVYPDKPQISSQLIGDKYQGSFTQKIAIISDKNITIPSLELKYFDKLTNKIKTISTKPIKITVKGQSATTQNAPVVQTLQPKQESKPQEVKTKIVVKESKELNYLFLLIGLILGSVGTYFFLKQQGKVTQKKESNIVKLIKNTNDNKKLFDILLPYANDHKDISDTLKQLEENIYKKANHKIDKQKLYDLFL